MSNEIILDSKAAAVGQRVTPMPRPPVISLGNIHKIYDTGVVRVHALKGISLRIERGDFVAVMGSSGSGKSTLMNLIGCLDRPSRGSYYLDGRDVSRLSKDERADVRNRKIGFVFQGFNLLSRTTALENVELPLIYGGVPSAERERRGRSALAAVGLGDRTGNHPNQLSGGQQQRVAIARGLVNNPALLLADEPTGNLDTRTSVEIMSIFQNLNRENNLTIVLVTHEPDIAQFAKRIVVLQDGRIKRDQPISGRRDARVDLESLPPPDEMEEEIV
jgi:putative ABC transport system ATP-binding protein